MAFERCSKCGRMHYLTDKCAGAPIKMVLENRQEITIAQAIEMYPASKHRGRPRIHADRKAYKAQKERERRKRRAAARERK